VTELSGLRSFGGGLLLKGFYSWSRISVMFLRLSGAVASVREWGGENEDRGRGNLLLFPRDALFPDA